MGSAERRDYYLARARAGFDDSPTPLSWAVRAKVQQNNNQDGAGEKAVPPVPPSLLAQENHLGDTLRQRSAAELCAQSSPAFPPHPIDQAAVAKSHEQHPSQELPGGLNEAEEASSLSKEPASLSQEIPERPRQEPLPSTEDSRKQEHMQKGAARADNVGKGKGPGVPRNNTNARAPSFVEASNYQTLLAVPVSVAPPDLPDTLTEGAIYKRMDRLFKPRSDGSYLVPRGGGRRMEKQDDPPQCGSHV